MVVLLLRLLHKTATCNQTEKCGRTWEGKNVDYKDKDNVYINRYEKKHPQNIT